MVFCKVADSIPSPKTASDAVAVWTELRIADNSASSTEAGAAAAKAADSIRVLILMILSYVTSKGFNKWV